MQTVAVGWQVYALTHSPLQLGYVGLVQFLPAVGFALLTGDAADRFDRRNLLGLSSLLLTFGGVMLWLFSFQSMPPLYGIYFAATVVGTARAISSPAGQALVPNLVPIEYFPNAVAWSSSIWQVSTAVGPAIGGLVYGLSGSPRGVYGCTVVLELLTTCLYFSIRTKSRGTPKTEGYWQRLSAGVRYVWRHKAILGAISLDLFAVLFGGAVALLPVFASDILHVGPSGLGWLRSAPSIGAVLMALVLAKKPVERHAGRTLFSCVGLFGLSMIAFGLSRNFWLSLALLTFSGAVDMVSVVMRHTLVQLHTPDDMRGRVGAVSLIFVGASNELGEFESGVTASAFGTVPSVALGGLATLAVVLIWSRLFPTLRKVDRLHAAETERA
jgi:MFS family permease